ncbi:hypothetical protein VTJ49DRAFT_7262 [Mycothermus thermophilus]|uniref:protein-histidine N-methyltransferase n=1 Tax=Humicola insolens TaxID=85995 RepID=A0ABR3VHC4_HUMIN
MPFDQVRNRGDDIEEDTQQTAPPPPPAGSGAANPASSPSTTFSTTAAGAFPVQGKPLLPPLLHDLDQLLARLPSKIAFGLLHVDLEVDPNPSHGDSSNGRQLALPRRELWDVRVQLMAEDDDPSSSSAAAGESSESSEARAGLGQHDVKTGIYEGGFKSWESSVDMVKVLARERTVEGLLSRGPSVVVELGCGTALPSLALFTWALNHNTTPKHPLSLVLADYNPSVLYLVTLPNLILAWALQQRTANPLVAEAFTPDGELELTLELLAAFRSSLAEHHITFTFLSGAWSPEFVDLLYSALPADLPDTAATLVLGSETIYSPFALESFSATLFAMLQRERRDRPDGGARAVVAAKRLYFGVGGSLDDFVDRMRAMGAAVRTLAEETQGVHRGVVDCVLP